MPAEQNQDYQKTMYACFTGYIVQAIINNFIPLLFLRFQNEFGIPLSQITFLVTFNFGFQLLIDFLSSFWIDRIGYRPAIVAAHACSALGLLALVILPGRMLAPFPGLLTAVLIYAVGGGLIEVLVSPIVEACPSRHKEAAMSLLHSFYCWGHVGVVLLSTLFFFCFGIEHWRILACLWAVIPLWNMIQFMKVPLADLEESQGEKISVSALLNRPLFWIMVLMMLCAGASEQAVSQWASAFAEQGLRISKTLGDLAGPMLFAIMMGSARVLYSRYGHAWRIRPMLMCSAAGCVCSYLLTALAPWAWLSLAGCGLCGFFVGVLWPGSFSLAAVEIRGGGTAMFALLALAGDLGCAAGPTVVGQVSAVCNNDLQTGILAALIFPLLLILSIRFSSIYKGKEKNI